MKNKIFGFAFLFAFHANCHADEYEAILKGSFREAGYLQTIKSGQEMAEFCFDEWCDVFKWSTTNSASKDIWEAIAVYERVFGKGSEIPSYRNQFDKVQPSSEIYKKFCNTKGNKPESCNWPDITKFFNLTISLANYDEGYRCEAKRVSFTKGDWVNPKCKEIKDNEKTPFDQRPAQ